MKMLATLPVLVALAGTAFAADSDRCLFANQIDGFSDASRHAVTLTANSRDFKVEFAAACIGLDTALNVAAKSATSCFGPGDSIIFKDSTGFPQRCIADKVTFIPKDKKADTPAEEPAAN